MNEQTARLALPYILAGQAQKHIPHNEALEALDAIVQLAVLDRDRSEPPQAPASGARHIVAAGASGDWVGQAGNLAVWREGEWMFHVPRAGWLAYVIAEDTMTVFDGALWTALTASGAASETAARFGVNANADDHNRLVVKSNALLFSHDDASGAGNGSVVGTFNKAAPGNDAGVNFQSGWSTRALMGLFGDDDVRLKVSPDGAQFFDAMVVDRASGATRFPGGVVHAATGLRLSQLLPCLPVPQIWRIDAARQGTPRSYTIASVAGDRVTLATPDVGQFFSTHMRETAMVRVWNMTKAPPEPAWVTHNVAATQFTVRDAGEVASWSAGDTLRVGDPDPTGSNVLDMIAIDISPYLAATFGTAFPQRGVLMAVYASGAGGDVSLDGSGTGAAGSASGSTSLGDGRRAYGAVTLFTPELSPVSNSNLVFLREDKGGASALSVCYLRLTAVYT